MKIAKSIRAAYSRSKPDYQRLSDEVCATLQPKVEGESWFFIHRLKEQESFALKIETGRVDDPNRMEDFFACTIVVPTVLQIAKAEEILEEWYEVAARRPPKDEVTHKRASDFVFDDLRLYLKQKPSETGRNSDLDGIVFEVQIKTILQYAWGIASHDLIYKTDNVSWPKQRIAFQVKAMLEHAEIAIAEAGRLAESTAISKTDLDTSSTLEIIVVLRGFFPADRLPRDIRRLAESIRNVLKTCDVQLSRLNAILSAERTRFGLLPANISPYAFLVQALAHSTEIDFKAKITSGRNKNTKILVHDDMDLPDWMETENVKIIRL
jgi:ppGpp synthetase/RelA/SpoT-type nucleotidyltranferase